MWMNTDTAWVCMHAEVSWSARPQDKAAYLVHKLTSSSGGSGDLELSRMQLKSACAGVRACALAYDLCIPLFVMQARHAVPGDGLLAAIFQDAAEI